MICLHLSIFFLLVSCGQLVKQAIEDETKMGTAMKPYVNKNMMGKFPLSSL
jgi:hypothetical protein